MNSILLIQLVPKWNVLIYTFILQFGSHIFNLEGNGVFPSAMDPITITASLKSSSMQVINFTNPLDIPTNFSVSLTGQDLEHFCLLMKRTNSIMLHPGVSVDIPVMFAPDVMYGHKAEVTIVADERSVNCLLQWCYPIFGQPELVMDSGINITCRAKERIERKFSVSVMNSAKNTSSSPVERATSTTGKFKLHHGCKF